MIVLRVNKLIIFYLICVKDIKFLYCIHFLSWMISHSLGENQVNLLPSNNFIWLKYLKAIS